MSESTDLIPVDFNNLPSTQVGTDEQFAELAKSTEFLARLQLYTKGKAINKGLVRPGHYGIPASDEDVEDIGDEIDIIPLARRPKAIDMTDTDAVLVNYDPESEEFKRIAAQSLEKESHCMYGPSFLVFERKHRPLPGILLRQQVHPQRGQEDLPLPGTHRRRHRPPEGRRPRRFRLGAARPAAADAQEPAGRERSLLLARPRRRQVLRALHEDTEPRSAFQGDHQLHHLQGRRRGDRQGARGQEAACSIVKCIPWTCLYMLSEVPPAGSHVLPAARTRCESGEDIFFSISLCLFF